MLVDLENSKGQLPKYLTVVVLEKNKNRIDGLYAGISMKKYPA
ncbi:hypothetical protein RU95_GL000419 [Enterococcus avium]|nr:hypothetical protein RU95_GL000419 [Enterococcus avium]